MAPAYLLPHDKTKTDGDKRRTGGGLIRSLNHVSATCKAAFNANACAHHARAEDGKPQPAATIASPQGWMLRTSGGITMGS